MPGYITELELLLRGIATGAALVAALGMLDFGGEARAWRVPARWTGALFCVAVAGFIVHTHPGAEASIGMLAGLTWLLSAAGTAYFWMFAITLFSDVPFTGWRLLPVFGMTMLSAVGRLLPAAAQAGLEVAHNLLEVALVAHALYVVWQTGAGDLVAGRRAFRTPFLVGVGGFCIVLSGFDAAWSLGFQPAWVKPSQAMALALLCLVGAAVFVRARSGVFVRLAPDADEQLTVDASDEPAAAMPESPPAQVSLHDQLVLAKLAAVMMPRAAADRRADAQADGAPAAAVTPGREIWRREGLTIGALAEAIGTQEHRLRRLINQHLGHRNFADFLNAHRLVAAKLALRAPALGSQSVSTIAFALGYSSLGPFNRAFKSATGLTPTDWRRGSNDPREG